MKLGKLSLVAVMALGTSAFAIDNVKVNGEAKLYYQTSDVELTSTEIANGAKTGLFEKGSIGTNASLPGAPYSGAAAGGSSLVVGATADLLKGISAGAELQVFSTLGLENNLVNDTMAPGGATGAIRTQDAWTMSQGWMAATFAKTVVKAGRMELDTPLAFTEKWNIVKNTFEGVVALNSDLPDTTLVGAWVGKHNGYNDAVGTLGVNLLKGSTGRTTDIQNFNTFGKAGAYAFAAVNKSVPNTTLQAWYYDVVQVADAIWLQADTKVAGMVNLGAQYATMDPQEAVDDYALAALNDSSIWALKASVDVSGVNVYAAYSQADKDGTLGFSNVATGDKTSIYTGLGSIYMDGIVTAPGAKTYKLGASGKLMDTAVSASYCDASDIGGDSSKEISAWDISASKTIGGLGLTAIYTEVSNDLSGFYGNRDIDSLRLIASLKF